MSFNPFNRKPAPREANPPRRTPRHLTLGRQGQLLISTDLHGNWDDLQRLKEVFFQARAETPQTFWVILGDAVHGPNPEVARQEPELYGYEDHSFRIVEALAELLRDHPENVFYVLGNHDHAHIGGPHTHKFHEDEVKELESNLSVPQRRFLRGFFNEALLAVAAPCGVLCCHGSPDATLMDLSHLDDVGWDPHKNTPYANAILAGFLRFYGQTGKVTQQLLDTLSRPGLELNVVIHGHDKDEAGWFTEGGNQVCPVLFGAPRGEKRYLFLDLSEPYPSAADFVDGRQVRRLYP